MKRILFGFAVPLLALAQGYGGGGPGLNMTRLQTVTGTVSAVRLAYGAEYPTVTVQQVTIKTAPVWYFLNHDFELKAGDVVRIVAAASRGGRDSYLHAIEISNNTTGTTLRLRDDTGLPLWSGTQGGGNRVSPGGGCPCATTTATASGIVESVTAAAGIQMPTLVLKTADGQLLSIKIGPERVLLAADFELKAGDAVTVLYTTDCQGEYLALQITNAAGVTVVLRDSLGRPAWPQ